MSGALISASRRVGTVQEWGQLGFLLGKKKEKKGKALDNGSAGH